MGRGCGGGWGGGGVHRVVDQDKIGVPQPVSRLLLQKAAPNRQPELHVQVCGTTTPAKASHSVLTPPEALMSSQVCSSTTPTPTDERLYMNKSSP